VEPFAQKTSTYTSGKFCTTLKGKWCGDRLKQFVCCQVQLKINRPFMWFQTHPDYRYTCHFCFKTFSRKDHLTIHEDLHTTSGETFPCNQCGATFKNRKTLTGHMKTHTSQKDFKCNECDSEFTRRASLNRHIRAAHAGQVITCPLCPAVFSYRSTLEDHKKAAHNEGKREFGCSLCGVQFAVKAYLSKHMVSVGTFMWDDFWSIWDCW